MEKAEGADPGTAGSPRTGSFSPMQSWENRLAGRGVAPIVQSPVRNRTGRSAVRALSLLARTGIAVLAQSASPVLQTTDHRSEILSLQFLPVDGLALTSSRDRLVAWNAERPFEPSRLVDGDRSLGFSVSPDGSRLAVAALASST